MKSISVVTLSVAAVLPWQSARAQEEQPRTPSAAEQTPAAEGAGQGPITVDHRQHDSRYDSQLDQAARLTFLAGREAFVQGDYATALDRFRQAYDLSPRPMLLLNIASCLDRLRRDEETVAALRQYLASEDAQHAPNLAEVQARIEVLEEAIAARRREEAMNEELSLAAAVVPLPEQEPEQGGLNPIVFYSVAGAALASGAVLIWSGIDASSRNDDYESYAADLSNTDSARARSLYNDVEDAERRTNILIGVTAGLGVAAGALAFFTRWGSRETRPDTDAAVAVTAEGFVIRAGRRF